MMNTQQVSVLTRKERYLTKQCRLFEAVIASLRFYDDVYLTLLLWALICVERKHLFYDGKALLYHSNISIKQLDLVNETPDIL